MTLHRPSNVDDPVQLRGLLEALAAVARDLPLVFALHPRTRMAVDAAGLAPLLAGKDVHVTAPLSYLRALGLMRGAAVVLTDSGGVQEETTALGVPCLTIRDTTERPVTVDEGTNTLIGRAPAAIAPAVAQVLRTGGKRGRVPEFWDGQAAGRVARKFSVVSRGGERMRIVFFTHYYPPEVNAPASRTADHCRAWAARGHEVTVVTCAPNHPSGRVYPGYENRWRRRERVEGVDVVRVWSYLAANEGFLPRILNYVSYLVTATLALPVLPRPDVIVTTSPHLFCGLVGFPARRLKRAPWVLEVRDLWPESIVTVGAMRRGPAIRVLEMLETFAYRRADRIVAVTDSFVPHIADRTDGAKIAVVKNGVDLRLFKRGADPGALKRRFGLEGRFVAAYVGTHGMAHGLDTVLDAAALLREDPRIGFLLVGDGAERARLVRRAADMRLENVRIVGQLAKAEMPAVWAATDASLILLRRTDAFRKVLPSKMFEAMAMQCPIVLGVEGEARDLLDAAGAGIAIAPESAAELAGAVRRLADDPATGARCGAAGLAYVRAHFDREALAERMLGVLADAAGAAARA